MRVEEMPQSEPWARFDAWRRGIERAFKRHTYRAAGRMVAKRYEQGGMQALFEAAPAWRAKAARHDRLPPSAMAAALDGFAPSRGRDPVATLRLENNAFGDDTLIVCVPSGSFCVGRSDQVTTLMARVARAARVNACIVDYRLAPEHPCPAAIDDVEGVLLDLIRRGMPASRIAVVAVSAGAAIGLSAVMRLRDRGIQLSSVSLLSPWTDLALTGLSTVTRPLSNQSAMPMEVASLCAHLYLQDVSPFDPVASPVYGDLSRLPAMLVHTSKADALHDDARRLAQRAFEAGTDVTMRVWRHQDHAFEIRFDATADRAIGEVGRFIRSQLDL
jgi:acetyl esterase/lipase